MFISILELFKIGIGPSSSHTMGPMFAARQFRDDAAAWLAANGADGPVRIRCLLKGSLAFTGKGHASDRAVTLGLHGYSPEGLVDEDTGSLLARLLQERVVSLSTNLSATFAPGADIVFDRDDTLAEHPNGMVFELTDCAGNLLLTKTFFSVGGGFIKTLEQMHGGDNVIAATAIDTCPYPFANARQMMEMSARSGISIAGMKRANELHRYEVAELDSRIDAIWLAMKTCIKNGLAKEGTLPGGLNVSRRARALHKLIEAEPGSANLNDWLCAYAMAVNEENASGSMVVTAPTNGAAGVVPAVLYYFHRHEGGSAEQVRDFLLVAAAIGGLIKHNSSISGAEVGCQGEVGSASAMAAAGLCAAKGGTTNQIENAAEIALEHHLGMTCDPVGGLVQVPCIERNGFGAIHAHTAASLALRGTGDHFMSLDKCISAMKQTGLEMSTKYKETSLGGLAVSFTEC